MTRDYNADYYDLVTTQTDDIEFYRPFVDAKKTVLELGCGSGRVSLMLAPFAQEYFGVDLSETMLARARQKDSRTHYQQGDITDIELQRQFDLILAPYRVLQCLEKMPQVHGFFKVIRRHLAPGGIAIVNVFNPKYSQEELTERWSREEETPCGEYILEDGDVLKAFDSRRGLDAGNQVLYPELIYRRYRGSQLVATHVNPICMRYWYPDQFKQLIAEQGFSIVDCWGGYQNEPYGEGSELVAAIR